MRAVGVHQGLSPVLDVVRDYRWGRVEETFGEDPYLVGSLGSAYVRGLESCGLVATLKHFVGYSASQAARNHGPVSVGPRALRDVLLVPFEMAVREGGARSVMNSYSEIDGLPVAADAQLLTGVLRERMGVRGRRGLGLLGDPVPARSCTGSPAPRARPARSRWRPGSTWSFPTAARYTEPLADLVRGGSVREDLVDRAARRVLQQKAELGLLDADWSPESPAMAAGELDIDPPAHRALARELAEHSVVLLANDGTLPLDAAQQTVALVGPCADDPLAFLGCYSYPNHGVMAGYPELGLGIEVPTLLAGLRAELDGATVVHEPGCPIQDVDRSGFAAAVDAARAADVCIAAVGDRPGLFGRGTSGEGCDAEDLSLPGVQDDLRRRADRHRHAASSPSSCPGDRTRSAATPAALAAAVQAFLPGEEGGGALAGRPLGARGAVGQASRADTAQPGRAAAHLPASGAGRQQRRREQHRPVAAVRLRARALLHELRLLRRRAQRR